MHSLSLNADWGSCPEALLERAGPVAPAAAPAAACLAPDPQGRPGSGPRRLFLADPDVPFSPGEGDLAVFCVALEGAMVLEVAPGRTHRIGSALMSTRAGARLRAASPVACFTVTRGGLDHLLLKTEMGGRIGGHWVGHRREGEIARGLKAAGPSGATERVVAELFGLPRSPSVDPRIEQAIRHIQSEPALAHRASALARRVGLSESRFRHAFREATGVTLTRFRVRIRLGMAMSLAFRGVSLTHAAHAAGFASSAHLSSAHRSLFGRTPSAALAAAHDAEDPVGSAGPSPH